MKLSRFSNRGGKIPPRLSSAGRVVAGLLLLLVVAPVFLAQQAAGTLKGSVTDELGGLVPQATITLRGPDGREYVTTTGGSGLYQFGHLPRGLYQIRVEAAGFSVYEQTGVEIRPAFVTSLNVELKVSLEKQDITVNEEGLSTDSERNASALILRGRDLEALPTDAQAFAQALRALAGPQSGPNGPQITVDGFSNGQIPPKESIREIRINQNPFSAENEYPGGSGIEIYTQPGADKFHGGLAFNFNDESLNSRGPYAPRRAPYQHRGLDLNLSGPLIPKRASFSFNLNRHESESNSVVYATILDPGSITPVLFNQSFLNPSRGLYSTARFDLKLNAKHTLVGSYQLNGGSEDLQGIGGFSLPSRAFRSRNRGDILQLTETAIINERVVNETRLQLFRQTLRQQSADDLPALNVLDSFLGGGAQVGDSSTRHDRLELKNFTSWSAGNHFVKFGWQLRGVRIVSVSPANFGGTYTFTGGLAPLLDAAGRVVTGADGQPQKAEISSLERYRRTLLFQRENLSAGEIRLRGGGATQFSIAGGHPRSTVSQYDTSSFLQDDWKVSRNFSLSPGLRYENQTNINSHLNFAPRLGFAWSPSWKRRRPATASASSASAGAKTQNPAPTGGMAGPPRTVIRGGIGLFYNRISEQLILQAARFNGLKQQQYVVSDPQVLDLFPLVPSTATLASFRQAQTVRTLAPDLQPLVSWQTSLSLERQLPHNLRFSLNYTHSRDRRIQRTVNLNAPLAGTYFPDLPTSGTRPLGDASLNVYATRSDGRSKRDQLSVSLSGNVKKIGFWGSYILAKTESTDGGVSGSPFDPYDFSQEWGRAPYDIRHFAYLGGYAQLPLGIGLNTFIITNSGAPFNITLGRDTNGDTFFEERPAFATDLRKPGVIVTPLGAFDPNPSPTQQLIPRNLGRSPGYIMVNLGLDKIFSFGRAAVPPAGAAGPAAPKAAKQPVQRPYQLVFSLYVSNLLNHANEGPPVGNMASPYFLKSNGSTGGFMFFGPGGTGGNRQINLRVRLGF